VNAADMERAIVNLPPITIAPPVRPIEQGRPYNPQTPNSGQPQSMVNTPPNTLGASSNTTTGPGGGYITAALGYMNASRVEESYAAIQQAYVLEPDNSLVHRTFGQVFARRKPPQIDQAVRAYNRSLQLNPNDAETHKLLADVSLYLRKLPLQAIPEYTQTLRINPNDLEAHQRLAQCYEEVGQWEPALREYQEAARLAPKQIPFHQKVGQIAMRLSQHQVAERAFVTVLTLNPAEHQTRFLLSQVYENEGKLADAERECSYVAPMIPAAQQVLMRIRSRLGR